MLPLLLACVGTSGPAVPAGHAAPVYGGDLVIGDDDDYRTLDPAIAYDERGWAGEWLMFDTLVRYDADLHLVPMLATAWTTTDDGRTWTFSLRDDVTFHNGRHMVAADVVYSWTRLFDPALASPGADFFGAIEGSAAVLDGTTKTLAGLSAPDDTTVVVHLSEADPTFLNAVAMLFGAVVPKEEVEARGAEWAWRPVGTGPFELSEWALGEKTVFVANRHYWDPELPYVDRIVHLAGYPRNIQFLKLEAGEIHQVERVEAPDYLWLRQDPLWSKQLVEVPLMDTYGELMNCEMPPFDNVWFRRAVSSAIDREKLNRVRNGRLVPSSSFLPPGMAGYEEGLPWQTYDVAKAKEAMAKAGYPDGYPEPIPYMTLTDEASRTISQSIQQDLAAIGIHIDIQSVTFPVYLTATQRKDTVKFAYTAWSMDYPHPSNFLEAKFHSKNISDENSVNDARYSNPAVDALLDRARATLDLDAQTELYRQAHRLIAADAPYVFEYHSSTTIVTAPILKGFVPNPVYTRDFRTTWLDLPTGRPTP
jgi:ABC-type transport system substrate-binding protein